MNQWHFASILVVVAMLALATCGREGYLHTLDGNTPLASASPRQNGETTGNSTVLRGFDMQWRADYEITALVVSKRKYSDSTKFADLLAPYDLVLAWGPLSRPANLHRLSVGQKDRQFHWREKDSVPLIRPEIIRSWANVHLIPRKVALEKKISKIVPGDIVTIKGGLVDVFHPSGWNWQTSTTRTDSGDGSCEIILVDKLEVRKSR